AGQAFERGGRLQAIPGAPPDLSRLTPGCAFAPRCAKVRDACRSGLPDEIPVGPGHVARCILLEKAPLARLSTV
ncbi:MAG TPA: oligopeptide/dipeptide ABC transporter ATP-binding protein, partial [Xanthobacteraceae bacterium]